MYGTLSVTILCECGCIPQTEGVGQGVVTYMSSVEVFMTRIKMVTPTHNKLFPNTTNNNYLLIYLFPITTNYLKYFKMVTPTSVVVIDLRYDVLNYNYLWLKPQLLPITITQILRL